jgi:hypothetical protein
VQVHPLSSEERADLQLAVLAATAAQASLPALAAVRQLVEQEAVYMRAVLRPQEYLERADWGRHRTVPAVEEDGTAEAAATQRVQAEARATAAPTPTGTRAVPRAQAASSQTRRARAPTPLAR